MKQKTPSHPKEYYLKSDTHFNELFPPNMQMLARRHWTPIHVAELATAFLTKERGNILDIGSGLGKFCLAGACFAPQTKFYGVEQRKYLINYAQKAQRSLGIHNASFIHSNFTELNLTDFDHFYFYNAFYENIDQLDRIDDEIEYSHDLYKTYITSLFLALEQMPFGTRIATYHSFEEQFPKGYELVDSLAFGDLKFWIKNT